MKKPPIPERAVDAVKAADAILEQAVEAKKAGHGPDVGATLTRVMETMGPLWVALGLAGVGQGPTPSRSSIDPGKGASRLRPGSSGDSEAT